MAYASKQKEITNEALGYINEIFKRLAAICPAYKQAFSSTEELQAAKQEWITGFYDAGIRNKSSVDYALNKLRQSGDPFIPPVGRFIAWCHEGDIPEGTKTTLEAYKEICQYQCLPREKRQPWGLSPEVFHTLYNLGDHVSWKVMNKQDHKKYWDDEYKVTLQTLRDGGPLHQPRQPTAHIENKRTPLDKPKAISALQAMRDQLK